MTAPEPVEPTTEALAAIETVLANARRAGWRPPGQPTHQPTN